MSRTLGVMSEGEMTRVAQWRWPSLIPRKALPRLTVARVSSEQQTAPALPEADDGDACESDVARRDFQDTLPLVFHVGGSAAAEAADA